MRPDNLMSTALGDLAIHAAHLERVAAEHGEESLRFAYGEIRQMLFSLAKFRRSPLYDLVSAPSFLSAKAQDDAYYQARTIGLALAILYMSDSGLSRYAACKKAAAHVGISHKLIERGGVPKTINERTMEELDDEVKDALDAYREIAKDRAGREPMHREWIDALEAGGRNKADWTNARDWRSAQLKAAFASPSSAGRYRVLDECSQEAIAAVTMPLDPEL